MTQVPCHTASRAPDGTITTFDAPGAGTGLFQGTYALGINPAGAITGTYIDASNAQHGFLRAADGTFTTFDPPGSTGTSPLSINPAGAITGYFYDASALRYGGFVRAADGTISTFNPPGSIRILPLSINPAGAITGRYNTSLKGPGWHGFLRSP